MPARCQMLHADGYHKLPRGCGRHGFHHTEGGRVMSQNLSAAPTTPSNRSSQPSPANLWSCSPAICSRSSLERLDDPAQRSIVRCSLRDLDCPTTAVCETSWPPKPDSVGDLATRGCPGGASLTALIARGALTHSFGRQDETPAGDRGWKARERVGANRLMCASGTSTSCSTALVHGTLRRALIVAADWGPGPRELSS